MITDRYATARDTPEYELDYSLDIGSTDVELGGSSDANIVSSETITKDNKQGTRITFSRKLKTGDKWDVDLAEHTQVKQMSRYFLLSVVSIVGVWSR